MSIPTVTNPPLALKGPGGIPQFQAPAPVNGSARMDAIQTMNANDTKLTALNNAAGGSRRKYRGGEAGVTVLPPGPTPIYKDNLAGTPYGAQNQTIGAMTTTLNQNEQSKYDQVQLAKGGTKRKRRGGVKWGCYSGGKRKSRRHSKKSSRKSRKSRRK
jgi:hypothetical protein